MSSPDAATRSLIYAELIGSSLVKRDRPGAVRLRSRLPIQGEIRSSQPSRLRLIEPSND